MPTHICAAGQRLCIILQPADRATTPPGLPKQKSTPVHHWVENDTSVKPVASPDLFEALEVLAQLGVHTRRHDLAGLAVPEVATSVKEPIRHLHPLHIPTSDTAVFPMTRC